MEVYTKRFIQTTRKKQYNFYPFGDLHLGSASCDERKVKSVIKRLAEDNDAIILLMGDMGDFISRKDPRFASDEIASWIPLKHLDRLVDIQVDYIVELLDPIKDKIVGALEGNHEEKTRKHWGTCPQQRICSQLGVENLGYSALIRLEFKRGPARKNFEIYATHGHGGGRKAGSKINRLHDAGADVDANLYLMAHTHDQGWAPNKPFFYMNRAGNHYSTKNRMYGLTGSYLKTWARGVSGYGERAGFPPVGLGGIYVELYPHKATTHEGENAEIPREQRFL